MPQTWVYYLRFETPEQEAAGARFLNWVADVSPNRRIQLSPSSTSRDEAPLPAQAPRACAAAL